MVVTDDKKIGVVVIGRNEGERLRRCLESVCGNARCVVYVDSGSTDGSVRTAKDMGASVVELDLSRPFTAARARNAGVERLVEVEPDITWIQFVDGDCEIIDGYLDAAVSALADRAAVAAVAGRLRERHPDASIYNRLCDMEWNTPIGDVAAVGGISMFRRAAFDQVGGFNPQLIAGEEPELCVRLRLNEWQIRRIDTDMGWHDAAMVRFGQWWRRSIRGGFAAIEGAVMHGRGPLRHKVADVRRTLFWGVALPVAAIVSAVLAVFVWPWMALGVAGVIGLYLLWAFRMIRRRRRAGIDFGTAVTATGFELIGRFASIVGFLRYVWGRLTNRGPNIIEYKDTQSGDSIGPDAEGQSHATDLTGR